MWAVPGRPRPRVRWLLVVAAHSEGADGSKLSAEYVLATGQPVLFIGVLGNAPSCLPFPGSLEVTLGIMQSFDLLKESHLDQDLPA